MGIIKTTVTLVCGHSVAFPTSAAPVIGDITICWRCPRDSAGRVIYQVVMESPILRNYRMTKYDEQYMPELR